MADLNRKGTFSFLTRGVDSAKRQITGLRDSMRDLNKSTTEQSKAGKEATDTYEKKLGPAIGKLKTGLAAVAGAYAALKSAQVGLKWAEEGAKVQDLAVAFENLSAKAGRGADSYLSAMDKASRGTIARSELMRKANYAMLLGLNADFSDILKIARATASATGQSVDYMTESLVVGIGRQSKLWLDNLGILVDTEAAYDRMAAKLGKTADALTEAERKQAFTNAAMKAGLDLVAKIGERPLAADPFAQLAASSKDLGDQLKQALIPPMSVVARLFARVNQELLAIARNEGRETRDRSVAQAAAALHARTSRTGASITSADVYDYAPAAGGEFLPGLSLDDIAQASRRQRFDAARDAEARARRWWRQEASARARMAGNGLPAFQGAPGVVQGDFGGHLQTPDLAQPANDALEYARALGAVGRQMEIVALAGNALADNQQLAGQAMLFTKNATDSLGNAFAELLAGNSLALQEGMKFIAAEAAARLKSIAAQASVEALWQTALGIGSLAFGQLGKAGADRKSVVRERVYLMV